MEKRDPSLYDNADTPTGIYAPVAKDTHIETSRSASETHSTKDELENGGLVDKVVASEEEAKEQDGSEDETEYPTGLKLVLITIALSLSVFCIALVCHCPLRQL